MLVDLDLALQRRHAQLEGGNPLHHLVRVLLAQPAPLLGVRGFVIADQALEHRIGIVVALDRRRLDLAMHREVIPGGHARQIGIDRRRHIGVWPHEGHQRLGPRGQVLPMRIGLGAVAEQNDVPVLALLHMQRQMGDVGEAFVVVGDQAGKRVLAHDRHSERAVVRSIEVRWEVHRFCGATG